jgi:hypothetical protein
MLVLDNGVRRGAMAAMMSARMAPDRPLRLIGQEKIDRIEGLFEVPLHDHAIDRVVSGDEVVGMDENGGVERFHGLGRLAGGQIEIPEDNQGRDVVRVMVPQRLILGDRVVQAAFFEVDRAEPLRRQLQISLELQAVLIEFDRFGLVAQPFMAVSQGVERQRVVGLTHVDDCSSPMASTRLLARSDRLAAAIRPSVQAGCSKR